MPYISQDLRSSLKHGAPAESVGELNYLLTTELLRWVSHQGLSYATLNSAIGVLECMKQELYRRMGAPYEDSKCSTNGDVFPKMEK